MEEHAMALADAIEAALPAWVERSVERVAVAWSGRAEPDVMAAAAAAGRRAAEEVGPRLRALLAADVDEQRTGPLALLRTLAVPYPTEVLRAAGVPPVERDEMQERLFPEDLYDLAPARFADLDPDLAELGIVWGAWKADRHRHRHQGPRRRREDGVPVSRIAAYAPDLMDRSKIAAAGGDGGVTFVASPAELASVDADVVVVDLSRPGVLEALPGIRARTIGFGRHTHVEVLDAARAAGCQLVLKRSEFFPRVEELLRG